MFSEVVLGLKYDVAIDVWSLGCVLVEMHMGEPLFNGSDEADQLRKIMEILGPIPNTVESSPKIAKLEKQNPKLAQYLQQQRSGTFKALRSLEDIVGMRTGGPGGRRKGAGHDVKAYEVFVDLYVNFYDTIRENRNVLHLLLFVIRSLYRSYRNIHRESSNTTNASGDLYLQILLQQLEYVFDQMDTSEPDNSMDQDDAMDQDSDQMGI